MDRECNTFLTICLIVLLIFLVTACTTQVPAPTPPGPHLVRTGPAPAPQGFVEWCIRTRDPACPTL